MFRISLNVNILRASLVSITTRKKQLIWPITYVSRKNTINHNYEQLSIEMKFSICLLCALITIAAWTLLIKMMIIMMMIRFLPVGLSARLVCLIVPSNDSDLTGQASDSQRLLDISWNAVHVRTRLLVNKFSSSINVDRYVGALASRHVTRMVKYCITASVQIMSTFWQLMPDWLIQ